MVTGSAGRLGGEFARALCGAGASVILADIDSKRNRILERGLRKRFGDRASSFELDVSDRGSVRGLAGMIRKAHGKPDILVNGALFNASIGQSRATRRLETFPIGIWDEAVRVNLTGVFMCSQELGGMMARGGGGTILNISSIYGLVGADQRIYGGSGLNSQPSYAATKGAVASLTRYMAAYWRGKNVRVNTLTLGGVLDRSYMGERFVRRYSERTILGRMAGKAEYNGALLFLASDASSYMTGADLVVDGGWTAW